MEFKMETHQVTLVDQVEDHLLTYFKEQDIKCGDSIPNEKTLAAELGVARSVIREALSRLRMMGLVYSRPRRGMILTEPSILGGMKRVVDPRILSENTLFDILGFRIALEEGIENDIFRNITRKDIDELTELVKMGKASENNEYSLVDEFAFHTKLYNMTGNRIIAQFQEIIHTALTFVKERFKEDLEPINIEMSKKGLIVTHEDLLKYICAGDEEGYKRAIQGHFEVYKIFMDNARSRKGAVKKPEYELAGGA